MKSIFVKSTEKWVGHMLKRIFIFIVVICSVGTSQLFAQDNIPVRTLPSQIFRTITKSGKDTIPWKWKKGGSSTFNFSQTSLSNWAAGGEKFSMSLSAYINLYLYHKAGRHTWDNNLDYHLGYLQTTSKGGQKNDDRFDWVSKYGLQIDSSQKWSVSALFNPTTQFFDGRTYYSRDSSTLSSSFLAPAYITLAIGFDYKPLSKKNLSIFFSPLTSRTTLLLNKSLSDQGLYSVTVGKKIYEQFGAFSMITYSDTIAKNIFYSGKLNLFSNYMDRPKNITFYLTNALTFRINKLMTASYNLNLIYDGTVKLFGPNGNSPALQTMSAIGIGFALPFRSTYVRS